MMRLVYLNLENKLALSISNWGLFHSSMTSRRAWIDGDTDAAKILWKFPFEN